MRELPRYAFLTHSEVPGIKVISLERPYIIASVLDYHRDDDRVQERMEDMVQGRYPIAKVNGFAIFLTVFTSLEPCSDPELQQAELNEMAKFFLEEKIAHRPGQFAKCEESGKLQRKVDRFNVQNRVLRERKKRTND
jgi:hypothetical protein